MTNFLVNLFARIESISLGDAELLEQRFKKMDPGLGEVEVALVTESFIKKALTLLAATEEEMKILVRKRAESSAKHQTSELRTPFPKSEEPEALEFRESFVHLHETKEMLLRIVSSSIRYENPQIGIGDLAIRKDWRVIFNSHMSTEMLDVAWQ